MTKYIFYPISTILNKNKSVNFKYNHLNQLDILSFTWSIFHYREVP